MKAYMFYHQETGEFSGPSISTSSDLSVAANTPENHIAMEVSEPLDKHTAYVNVKTGTVMQRSAKADPVKARNDAINAATREISRLEQSQHAVVRGALLGNPDALAKLREIDSAIDEQRVVLQKLR
jgi:hypothetical protein